MATTFGIVADWDIQVPIASGCYRGKGHWHSKKWLEGDAAKETEDEEQDEWQKIARGSLKMK